MSVLTEKSQRPRRPTSSSPNVLQTQRAVAKHFDVSFSTVRYWLASGCPGSREEGYDVEKIEAFRKTLDYSRAGHGCPEEEGVTGEISQRLKLAQTREREAKASLAELELKFQRGEYISSAEAIEQRVAMIHVFKRSLLGFENALATRLVGLNEKEIRTVWRTMARELLTKLSQM